MWKRGMVLGIVGWLAVAAGAVTVGVLAVALVGEGLTSGTSQPLSSDGVARALAQTTPVPTRSPSAAPSPTASARTEALRSAGGTVYAQCLPGNQAYLTSWTPHPGYETEEIERGPDRHASVRFETDDSEIKLIVSCAAGRPSARIETDTD